MTLTAADVSAPLARYARLLHALAGPRHHVASPLGAWLLLALCAPASEGKTRQTLNVSLGIESGAAAELAAALLRAPHPAVPAGAAVWHQGSPSETLARWLAGLPPELQAGPLPGQAGLDEWARRHTSGLIERFPIELHPAIYLVAATVLATRVSWQRPFDVAPASALGPSSPWAGRLTRVLRTPDGPGHEQFVAGTSAVGDVAVHAARAREGLLVTSVAAAPGVPAPDVISAAYELATALAAGRAVDRRSLFGLPLGESELWAISERAGPVPGGAARAERCTAVLPAWTARSEHDLTDPALGFAAAAQALAPGDRWQAGQAAMAAYSRTGFEAAAVTGMAVAMAMRPRRRGLVRTADLRFGHPYAVVAVTVAGSAGPAGPAAGASRGTGDPAASAGHSAWDGLPVFSAWVADPEDAGEA
jgi:hypothetical protein